MRFGSEEEGNARGHLPSVPCGLPFEQYQRAEETTTREKAIERAKRAIEKRQTLAFDVAANLGQIFDNVKHMSWFVEAIADDLMGIEY